MRLLWKTSVSHGIFCNKKTFLCKCAMLHCNWMAPFRIWGAKIYFNGGTGVGLTCRLTGFANTNEKNYKIGKNSKKDTGVNPNQVEWTFYLIWFLDTLTNVLQLHLHVCIHMIMHGNMKQARDLRDLHFKECKSVRNDREVSDWSVSLFHVESTLLMISMASSTVLTNSVEMHGRSCRVKHR